MRRRLVLSLGVLLATAACGNGEQDNIAVSIRQGSNFREAAESLAVHGLVRSPSLFRYYARLAKRDRSIRYGRYIIREGASWDEILTALEQGKGIVHRVTVPEGSTLWDIVPAIAKALTLPEDSVQRALADTAFHRRIGLPRGMRSLEGYLFPDTYDFPDGATARQAVDLMLKRFEREWTPAHTARAAEIKMTRHQVVTLASIIEKEVRRGHERPTVSAVYHNRLKIGQMLQADPTVQYALGRRRPGRVLYRDLRVDSPYNTYRRTGLPPGPIASPGGASITAALYPADVTYRYFVAHPDGHHEFRNTYAEHLRAIEYVRSVARADSLERRRRAAQAAVDSALSAAGVPRATYDSIRQRQP
ncbi:MAG: endolytic transglycosylase MltG [Gemmatimonadaceae bacterium]|nr:endolytic transglycosylase MltG [Gemmatimonadaceae bacterium]MCW5825881.1 endolytic transglycosylase MltG [Gemmatimonadaceae bacterium]